MLKRYLLVLVCLLCPAFAYAQRPLTIVGGVVTANVTDYNDFAVTLNANVTGVTLTTTVTPATGYQITMRFVQDATGSRTVAFGGNITSSCTINATALSVTLCRWQYTATGNTWADAGGSSSSSSVSTIGATFGDSVTGATLTTSAVRYITIPFACSLQGWHIMADAGTVTIKVARVNGGTALPTVGANSISTSGVALSTGTKVDSALLTDFTSVLISANDTLGFFITAVATAKQITFQLDCK